MDGLEVAGVIGETISWVGFGAGLPLLLLAGVVRLVDGRYTRTPVELIPGDSVTARWMTADGARERVLADWEQARVEGEDSPDAFVSDRDPFRMRLEQRHPMVRLFTVSGVVLVLAGVAGFAASWLPMFS